MRTKNRKGKVDNRCPAGLIWVPVVWGLLSFYSSSLATAQPVVETEVQPETGHAVRVPFTLRVTANWGDQPQPAGLRLKQRPEIEGLKLEGVKGKTGGTSRLEFNLTYIPEKEGTYTLEPVSVAFINADGDEQEVPGLSRKISVGPPPVPWWQGPKLIWLGLALLAIAILYSFSRAVIKAKQGNKREMEAPQEEKSAPDLSIDDFLLEARRKRLDGDLPGLGAALDRSVCKAVLETQSSMQTVSADSTRLVSLAGDLPENLRTRALELGRFCEELRYAHPAVNMAELDGAIDDARWLLERLYGIKSVTRIESKPL